MSVARMSEAISGLSLPHLAEPVIGPRFARTRWLMRATASSQRRIKVPMKAIFIDCNKQLAPVFARASRPDDPPITVHSDAFSSGDLPLLLAGYDICLDDHSY